MSGYTAFVAALVVTYVIAGLSLNLLMGYAGQVSLGQAAFVGVGAYATAELAMRGVPFPVTVAGGAVVAAGVATLAGLPSLRIRGLQVAATTLAFGVAAERLLFARPWAEASTSGVTIARPSGLSGDRAFLAVALAGLALVLVVDYGVRRGRIGRAFAAVRDREDLAAAWGVDVGATKLLAYAMAGLYAGVAGGLYVYLVERATPDSFTVWHSLGLVAVVVVGGLGSWRGVVVAAGAFAALPELLRPAAVYAPLAGALLLAVMPVLRPEGLGGLVDRLRIPRRPRSVGNSTAALEPPARTPLMSVPLRTLLVCSEVRVGFGGLQVLRGVDLEVRRGEIVGLIGPNGAGKTTFFNCVSGFVRPDAGSIRYRGRDLLALPARARPGLGIVRTFQQVGLSERLTVADNVLLAQHALARSSVLSSLASTPSARRDESAATARAEAAMALAGVEDLAGVRLGSLPHGQRRLAELAAAVAAGPELLLLDEPAAGSSPEESAALGRRLLDLRDELGLTVLVIEHHVPMVADICDHLYVLVDGAVMAQGPPSAVQRDPLVLAAYLGEPSPLAVAAGG